jgi:predicted transcriptional regulator
MRKSKLEFYDAILTALSTKPLTIDSLAYKCKMNCVVLSQRIEFLLKNDLVEEEIISNKKRLYGLTRRGTAIYKTLIIAKRLEKLQTTANQPVKSFPVFAEYDEEKTTSIR